MKMNYCSSINEALLVDMQQELDLSNDAFLEAVFRNVAGDQRPMCCSFNGHPGKVSSEKWFARPWVIGKTIFASQENNYFTLACFNSDLEGKYRRQKRNFAAQHALMLDDIGTKAVKFDRLTLPPSWLLETSPENFQAGYIFREPIVDGAIADRLMKSIIAAGLCDPGADGPLARLARLPVGNNGKYDPPFICRLVKWNPELRYNIQELVDGLRLDFNLIPERPLVLGPGNNSGAEEVDCEFELYVPRKEENPIITKLKEKSLYLRPLGGGKHEIRCPWESEHTDALSGGTAYFEPSESYPLGGFKCLHGHCSQRYIRDLREYLDVSRSEARNRSTIRMPPGNLSEIVDRCELELALTGLFYNRGGLITCAVPDHVTKEINFVTPSLPGIVRYLSSFVYFERFDSRRREWSCCDPPERYARILYDAQYYAHLPRLRGVTRQPYLRQDGSLVMRSGYDRDTEFFGLFDENKFSIPDSPSRLDAENALREICNLLDEFSFKTDNDRSAALSAILTAVIRPSLCFAPLFHFRAPQISSGKSYLAKLIIAFANNIKPAMVTFPTDSNECRKILLALLLLAPSVICFDNLTCDLIPHESLCSALTEEYLTGRILGFSKTATVGTRTLFLSTGNNVNPVRDMKRRTITVNLDPACEIPASRTFKKEPVEMVRSKREHYISLALTIIRAYIVAGRPQTPVKPLATYTEWSDLCRQPLLWLGHKDPAESIFCTIQQDPDREILRHLLHFWYHCFNNRSTMVRDAIMCSNSNLMEVFMEIAGDRGILSNKRLGRWISRHAGQIVDGLKFERDFGLRLGAEAWKVVSLTP